jgi:alkylated DNA repair dioxygenase AlkB
MSIAVQASLFDLPLQPEAPPLPDAMHRITLEHGAWVDVLPQWLRGADALFDRLLTGVPWVAERRRMYDRVVDVPRLLAFYAEGATLPDPLLAEALDRLNARYAPALGEPLRTAGVCL